MTTDTITKALGGRKAGTGWMAHCPTHYDCEPSLSIRYANDGKVLICCHAGCDQVAVIEALRTRGLWSNTGPRHAADVSRRSKSVARDGLEDASRTRSALDLWRASRPAAETPVEAYLRFRGLTLALPATLRFHVGLRHPSGGKWPAMIALVIRGSDGAPLAIHRTFLARDGAGKAPVVPAKMMLGPCRGGAVRLAKADTNLMVGEGIETCVAAMQATGRPAWAALSTSGLRAFDLPDDIRDVTVLADGDEPGEAAACDCARRWKREGRHVRITRPPRGQDFNDLLMARTRSFEEGGA